MPRGPNLARKNPVFKFSDAFGRPYTLAVGENDRFITLKVRQGKDLTGEFMVDKLALPGNPTAEWEQKLDAAHQPAATDRGSVSQPPKPAKNSRTPTTPAPPTEEQDEGDLPPEQGGLVWPGELREEGEDRPKVDDASLVALFEGDESDPDAALKREKSEAYVERLFLNTGVDFPKWKPVFYGTVEQCAAVSARLRNFKTFRGDELVDKDER